MYTDFDTLIERGPESGSFSSKWQGFERSFPGYDVSGAIPMWVADMDFPCPKQVHDAVIKRANHGIYGYASEESVDIFKVAASKWFERRHSWKTDISWFHFVPAVIPALNAVIQEVTCPGDGVIIQKPVYAPFMNSIRQNNRTEINNPLQIKNGRYEMDLDHLEFLAKQSSTKLMILCSPHNPVSRVWGEKELKEILYICRQNAVTLFSDEIHCDITPEGARHTPIGIIADESDNVITAVSPSKVFNLAGLQAALMIIPNGKLRERIISRTVANRLPYSNIFGPIAGTEAFTTGDDYVDSLNMYLHNNFAYLKSFLQESIPKVQISPLEGTYLAWLDFRSFDFAEESLHRLVFEKAKIAMDPGIWFGDEGKGFMRMNIACPRLLLKKATDRLHSVFC